MGALMANVQPGIGGDIHRAAHWPTAVASLAAGTASITLSEMATNAIKSRNAYPGRGKLDILAI